MKIAFFHNLPQGGAKRAVYEEIKYFSKEHAVDLYEYDSTDETFLDARRFCKNAYTYPFKPENSLPSFLNRLYSDYKNFFELNHLSKRIAAEIDSKNYNACIVHPDKFTQAPFLLRHAKTPTLYFCEEYLRIVYEKELEFDEDVVFFKRWYELVTRGIRKKIDRDNAVSSGVVVANSKFTKNNIDKAYGVNARFCHLGVAVDVFKPLRVKKDRKNYVIFIGQKSKSSNFDLIEKAVNKVPKDMRPDIKSLGFSKKGLQIQDDNLLAKEYSNALATICTSYNEPFGLAPIESMACETPVLAVNEGGYKETVVDGKTGYLLARDPNAFAEKIVHLIKHPKLVEKLGKAGRKHVKENFTWKKHNEKLEKILLQIAKKD